MRKLVLSVLALFVLSLVAAACGEDAAAPVIIEKEVVVEKEVLVEVPVEVIVEKEVVRTVEVPGETIVIEKEVVRTVEVPGETIVVTKEVIKEVPVEVVVTKEVIKEVPVEVVVIQEVIREVIKVVEVERPRIVQYSEAPILTQRVQAGELPPVNDRLPEETALIPAAQIGVYGGTMFRGYLGPADQWNVGRITRDGVMRFSRDGFSIIPAVAKAMEVSNGGKTWTISLRKGHKWSDGSPFTADDFVFQYNDYILNTELNPSKPSRLLSSDGGLAVISKVDDTTVTVTFSAPNFIFPEVAAQMDSAGGNNRLYQPAAYLKQFHPEFAGRANIEKMADDAGLGSVALFYENRADWRFNPEKLTLRPWRPQNILGVQRFIAERNAYFYAVDQAGNQLPYIDRVVWDLVESPDVLQLKAIAGEISFQGRHIKMDNFPVLKANEDAGDYKVFVWPSFGGVDARFAINQNYEGPEGDLLRNKDFRIALSVALNRDEINEISFLGLGIPRQGVPAPGHPDYPGDEVAFRHTEYDPGKANALLDGIGLTNRDGDGFRTLPNGDRLELVITVTPAFGPWPDVAEQGARYWSEVGVRTKADSVVRSLLSTRVQGNESMVTVWNEDQTGFTFSAPGKSAPIGAGNHWAPMWGLWFQTEGAQGMEPPQMIKDYTTLHFKGLEVPEAERRAIARQIYDIQTENMWIIGVAGLSPMVQGVVIVSNDLMNVPDIAGNDWPLRVPATAFPEQLFFRR